MTTRSLHIDSAPRQTGARRLGLGLAALTAAALLAASAPVPVVGVNDGAACTTSTGSCGG